jgi:hypothetical protein
MNIKVTYRNFADVVAALVAVGVLAVGVVVIAGDDDLAGSETTTTVVNGVVPQVPATRKTTTVVTRPARGRAMRQTTIEVQGRIPSKPQQKTRTTEEGPRTFLERVLGDGGVLILQIAAAVAAAFLAGAIVQRVLLGEYALKFGNVELSAIAGASTAGLEELKEGVKKLREESATAADLHAADQARREADAQMKEDLALAYKRMDLIEKKKKLESNADNEQD